MTAFKKYKVSGVSDIFVGNPVQKFLTFAAFPDPVANDLTFGIDVSQNTLYLAYNGVWNFIVILAGP